MARIIYAQTPVASFILPEQACLGEKFKLNNQSINAVQFEWDFCQGDLQLTPFGKDVISVPGNITAGADFVFDGNNWYAFVTSRETNSIKRLDFGGDLNTSPEIVDLGNIGSINPWRPIDIQVVYDNGEWYGFVYGESTNLITRIDFGSSISNTEGLSAEVIVTGNGNAHCGLSLMKDGTNYILAYSNSFSFSTIILSNIRAIPSPADRMNTGNIPGVMNFGDVKIIKHKTDWYLYLTSYGSQKIFRAKLGTNPLNLLSLTDISGGFLGISSPYGIDIGFDNGQYVAVLCAIDGGLIRINLGDDLDEPPLSGTVLGNLGVLGNTLKISMRKYFSEWTAMAVSWNSGSLFTIRFPSPYCAEHPVVLKEREPELEFNNPGIKHISLRAINGNAFTDSHNSLTIVEKFAPELKLESFGVCAKHETQFVTTTNSIINSYQWQLGNINITGGSDLVYQFDLAGDYQVSVSINSSNGCNNYVQKAISIYDEPFPDFELPLTNPFCTNQTYVFENSSAVDPGYPVTWLWKVNGVEKAITEDLSFSFTDTGNQTISLAASIPGCENEISKVIPSLTEGPLVNFTVSGQCEDSSIAFTNSSQGEVVGFSWNFDDGFISSEASPQHIFGNPQTYSVTLTATNAAGCINSKSKPVTIYSKPQVNFTIPLPPFSCSGLPTPFTDLTPNPFDSNLSSWQWTFGDGQGTSTQRNPQYTYANSGSYNVSLAVSTNFGCSETFQKTISIARSPVVDFSATSLCPDTPVNFTDISQGIISSRQWRIENATFTDPQINYRFNTPGSKPVTLTVEDVNKCISSLTKPVIIPAALLPDFAVTKACVNQQTAFDDITNDAADPIISRLWNIAGFGNGTNDPQIFTFSNQGNYNVRLEVMTQNGCQYALSRNVLISPSPIADFSSNPTFGAAPLTVQFTNRSSLASSYLWQFGDPLNSTSTLPSPSFTYNLLGDYQVSLTAGNAQGCATTIARNIQVLIPVYDISLINLELLPVNGGGSRPSVTIVNQSNVPLENLPVRFDLPEGVIIRDYVSQTIFPGQSYRFIAGFELPASRSLRFLCAEAELADRNTGDNKLCAALERPLIVFDPYPNPVSDLQELTIQWVAIAQQNTQITIANLMGQVIEEVHSLSQAGLNTIRFSSAAWQQGIYLVRFRQEGTAITFRVVKTD